MHGSFDSYWRALGARQAAFLWIFCAGTQMPGSRPGGRVTFIGRQ